MTSVATVVGHFPLVLASGPGASARNSIGIVLVTGMIIGTTFTLFVVPAFYMLIAKDRGGRKAIEEEVSRASRNWNWRGRSKWKAKCGKRWGKALRFNALVRIWRRIGLRRVEGPFP